eukprot:gb/GECG01001388.1/.p1 GENE.gb/GECG01001388.1/~~gb/GECG01001388.1/.p1  ORF type:complete len:360 (+),score=46.58 gb/GECG01001388.1/:1-1080(+)
MPPSLYVVVHLAFLTGTGYYHRTFSLRMAARSHQDGHLNEQEEDGEGEEQAPKELQEEIRGYFADVDRSGYEQEEDEEEEDDLDEEEIIHSSPSFRYNVNQLSEERRADIHKELRARIDAHKRLKKWGIKDTFLDVCLYSRHYHLDNAMRLVTNFVHFVEKHNWANSIYPKGLEGPLRTGFHRMFPVGHTDCDGHEIITLELGKLDFDSFSIKHFQQLSLYAISKVMERENSKKKGVSMVVDFSGLDWNTVKKVSTDDFNRGRTLVYDTIPLKVRNVFFVRQGVISRTVLSMVKPFMSKRVKQRMIMCKDSRPLTNFIPREYVPEEWGGTNSQFAAEWQRQVDEYIQQEHHPMFSATSR